MHEALSNSAVGKARRLSKLLARDTGRCVIVPLDNSLLCGPVDGLDRLGDKVRQVARASPEAVLAFQGLLRQYADELRGLPTILNVTASTIRSLYTRKTRSATVTLANRIGAEAVAVHINVGSKYEREMLRLLGAVAEECDAMGMPLITIAYPRSETVDSHTDYLDLKKSDPDRYTALVAHAVRIAVELGADFVKTQYTGTVDSFRKVVEGCNNVPLVAAGGPLVELEAALQVADEVVEAGGAGVSFGRNIFARPDSTSFIQALKQVVHERVSPAEAMENCFARYPKRES